MASYLQTLNEWRASNGIGGSHDNGGPGEGKSYKPIEIKNADGTESGVGKLDLKLTASLSDLFKGGQERRTANAVARYIQDQQAARSYDLVVKAAKQGLAGEIRAEAKAPQPKYVPEAYGLPKNASQAESAYKSAQKDYQEQSKALDKILGETGDSADYGSRLKAAQEETASAKAKMEDALSIYQYYGGKADISGNERIGLAIKSGAEGTASQILGTVGNIHEGGTRVSKAQLERDIADLQQKLEQARQNYSETAAKYGGDASNPNVQAAERAMQELAQNISLYQGMLENDSLERTTESLFGKANEMAQKSAEDIYTAKQDTSGVQGFLLDATAAGTQMLGDIALGRAIPGAGMLGAIGIRSYGGGVLEARNQGASFGEQMGTGAARAALEMATEKLFDGLAGAAGKGAADDVVHEWIRNAVKNENVRAALLGLYGVSGEAAEEALSSFADPIVKLIYEKDNKSLEHYFGTAEGRKELLADAAHDAKIGGFLGGVGSLASIGTGKMGADLAAMRTADANLGSTASQVNNMWDVLSGRVTAEEAQAREAAALEKSGGQTALEDYARNRAQTAYDNAQEAPAVTPAQQKARETVASVLPGGKVNNTNADYILNDPELRAAAAWQTGINFDGMTRAEARAALQSAARSGAYKSKQFAAQDYAGRAGERAAAAEAQAQAEAEAAQVQAAETARLEEEAARNNEQNYDSYVRGIILNGANRADANEIINNPAMRDAWERLTGKTLPDNPKSALKMITETTRSEVDISVDSAIDRYIAEKNAPPAVEETAEEEAAPETAAETGKAVSGAETPAEATQPVGGATTTPEEQDASNAPSREFNSEENAGGEPQTATNAPKAPFETPEGLNTKSRNRIGRAEQSTEKVEKRAGVPKSKRIKVEPYETKSEGQSVAEARARLAEDRGGEVQKLLEAEAWSGAQLDMASQLMHEYYLNGDMEAYEIMRQARVEHLREGGRAIQANAKYLRGTGESAYDEVSDAVDKNDRITPEQKARILENAKAASDAYDAAMKDVAAAKVEAEKSGKKAESPESLINLIKDTAAKRGTTTLFKKNLNRLLNAQKGNVDYLSAFAYNQILAMSNDYTQQRSFAEYVKTFQTLSMLTAAATFNRNVLGNVTFGTVDILAKDAAGIAIDKFISQFTGKRTVAFDKGFFSSAARKGAWDGLTKSALEVALDVDMNGGETVNRYDQSGGRTNKMTGGPVERFFSRWEQLLNYSLTTSDRTSRGAYEAEYARSMEALKDSGLSMEEMESIADQEASYRLFQNKGTAYKFSKGVHDVFNLAGFGGKVEGVGRKGGFGLGDIVNTFPGVPANLGVKPTEFSPLNIAKGAAEMIKVIKDAKAGKLDPARQYQAATDIARGLAGTPIIALFAAMFRAGLLKNWDDEDDKDAKALNAAEGKSGVQINLDAALRWLNGEGAEWRKGDDLESIGYLEPLNAFMGIGSLMANLDEDAAKTEYAKAYATGAIQSFLDIPVMSNLANMVETYNYSNAEDLPGKAGEALLAYAGNSLTGFVPSPVRSYAKASDPYYRDTRGSNVVESSINSLKAAIPGKYGRESLPYKLDNYGEPKMYSGNTAQRMFDTFVNPGTTTTMNERDETTFLLGLRDASGDNGVIPDRNPPKKLDIDGESVDLTQDEQALWQETYGGLVKQYADEMENDEMFASLSPDEQAAVIKELFSQAKQQAGDAIKDGRESEGKRSDTAALFAGTERPDESKNTPPLAPENLPEYTAFSTVLASREKAGDYAGLDEILAHYADLDPNTQEVLASKNNHDLRNLLELAGLDVSSSSSFYGYKDSQTDAQWELKKASNDGGAVKMLGLANADIPEEDKAKMMHSDAVSMSKNRLSAYDVLSQYGFTVKDTYDWFDDADWSYDTKTGEYKADETLNPLEVAAAIYRSPNIPDAEKSAVYQAFYDLLHGNGNHNYDKWVDKRDKPYTYESEIKYLEKTGYLYGKSAVSANQS